CLGVTIVFIGYVLVRAANSPVTYLWWIDFYMVLGCLLVYLLTTFYLTGEKERAAVIWALLILAVLEIFVGLRQFSSGDNWLPFGFRRADSGHRASGMLISSIHLAGYLETVGPLALSFAIWGAWKNGVRILSGYIATMCYLGIAITGSRGGYISALFSLLVFVAISLFNVKRTRPKKFRTALLVTTFVLGLSVFGAITLMLKSDLLRERLSMIPQQFEKNGLDIRIYNWQAALDQFRESPMIGTGAGTHIYYGRFFRRPPLQSDPIHAHSDYLELLAEYGIVGAVGMAAFLAVHLYFGWRNQRMVLRQHVLELREGEPARHNSLALYTGVLTAIAAMAAHSVVDFNMHIPGHAMIFAFLFGTLASPVYGSDPKATKWMPLRFALPVLGFWIFFSALSRFPAEYWAEKARVALRGDNFDESIAYAARALELDRLSPELFFTLGGAHRGAAIVSEKPIDAYHHLKAATDAYYEGLVLFPQDSHMLVRLGETLTALAQFGDAEEAFRAAAKIDPNHGRVHAYYAWYLASVGREKEAEEQYAKAKSLAHGDDLSTIVRGTSLDPKAGAAGPY
ncbi:MAG: O-antigen ligase family protein, partial [Chthoniobacteraceae bacterium]